MYWDVFLMKRQFLYILITIVITLCILPSCATKVETETNPSSASLTVPLERLEAAEKLFAQREDLQKLREAINLLAQLRNPEQRNYQVEWTYAKYNYFLGKYSTDPEDSEAALEKGRDAGKIASRVEPNKPDGYFWYGANLGELSKRSPVTVGLRSVGDIREAMNKVIEIDPAYQGASAYDALAQVELATRFSNGSAEKAVEYLEKGLEIEKENTNIRLHLAEAYLAVKKDAAARKQLDYLLAMKPDPEYLPEHKECIEKGKRLMQENF